MSRKSRKPASYTLRHRNYRNQDVYDPCGSGQILRVDGHGNLHNVTRGQAAKLLLGPAWSMKEGAERVAFEGAFIALAQKIVSIRDESSAATAQLRAALEAGEGAEDLQAFVEEECRKAGLPTLGIDQIAHGLSGSEGLVRRDDLDAADKDEDEDEDFTGDISPEALAAMDPEPKVEASAGPSDMAAVQERPAPAAASPPVEDVLRDMPWQAQIALAEHMGEKFNGKGSAARAKTWLLRQQPASVAKAMEEMKED